APECPSEVTTVVLDSSQVILQMHESIGHPVELDRVLGMEEAYAGTSFLTPGDRGKLRYGSDRITVVADASLAGGLGTFGIDDKRVNFQFGCEIAWRIEKGALTQMYRNPNYTGITTAFWGSCDAVGGREEWTVYGTPNCGKGQPGQVARVGHAASPARFRNV